MPKILIEITNYSFFFAFFSFTSTVQFCFYKTKSHDVFVRFAQFVRLSSRPLKLSYYILRHFMYYANFFI